MGYLDNTSVTVDAILTKRGRQLLAQGTNAFQITKFALADDEIDYTLWNTDHPNGSDYYGIVIQNTPLLEAFPDETQSMKYKLLTLSTTTQTTIPVVSVSKNDFTFLEYLAVPETITPQTLFGGTLSNTTTGYTAILSNGAFFDLQIGTPNASSAPTIPSYIGDISQSVVRVGQTFTIRPKPGTLDANEKRATITIIGNDTGGATVITLFSLAAQFA
jgi:hypothetical protein